MCAPATAKAVSKKKKNRRKEEEQSTTGQPQSASSCLCVWWLVKGEATLRALVSSRGFDLPASTRNTHPESAELFLPCFHQFFSRSAPTHHFLFLCACCSCPFWWASDRQWSTGRSAAFRFQDCCCTALHARRQHLAASSNSKLSPLLALNLPSLDPMANALHRALKF